MATDFLPFDEWVAGTLQNSVPANSNALRSEAVIANVISDTVTAQPGSPVDGDCYIITAAATGSQWATFAEGSLAYFRAGTWYEFTAFEGLLKVVAGEIQIYSGTTWVPYAAGGSGSGGGAVPIQEEGSTIVAAPTAINFVGAGATVTDDGGVATVTIPGGGGGGLTNFTDSISTAAPNATVPVVSLDATNAATNVDAAVTPKAAGAFLLQVPNNLTSGGNKRGSRAVDLQTIRATAAQVASGAESFIGAGRNNTASAANSAAIGGQTNNASGASAAILGGNSNTASGQRAICIGGNAGVASGNDCASIVGGNANANGSVAIGNTATVNAVINAFSEGSLSNYSRSRYTLQATTTNATPVVLTTDSLTAVVTNQATIGSGNNRSGIFRGMVVARQTGNGGAKKSWEFHAHLDRDNTVLTLVAAVTPTVVADSGVPWTLAVTSSGTFPGSLVLTGTGEAGKTIRWAAYIDGQECQGT